MSTERLQLDAGARVFDEGDEPTDAFLIESGLIEIMVDRNGVPTLLAVLGPGELIGEMAVIGDERRGNSARVLEAAVLVPIARSEFVERLSLADPVVRALLISQVGRYRSEIAALTGVRVGKVDTSGNAGALDKIRLESELRSALDLDELEVRLQPIVDIASGAIAGYEALTRWQHPERGEVLPTDFIKLAEETSLILPIGDYVLTRVCETLAQLQAVNAQSVPFVAMNVSARQIADPRFVERVLRMLRQYGVAPDRIKLEVTENLAFNHARLASLIKRCHAAGVHVALDDFGTGYSNLNLLASLHFDQIKLDQSFIRALEEERTAALVKTIATMAKALDCDLIAEGVETPSQYQALRELGCRYAQGWLVGRPQPLADVIAASRAGRTSTVV
ncbi:MAG: EAL domain-containing protein [Dokdonella sp.]